jgi:hypothetical protein
MCHCYLSLQETIRYRFWIQYNSSTPAYTDLPVYWRDVIFRGLNMYTVYNADVEHIEINTGRPTSGRTIFTVAIYRDADHYSPKTKRRCNNWLLKLEMGRAAPH